MTDCYIYDTVRTPRGKGKKNGTLHEVTALELATQVLNNIKDRTKIDTADVDDVVLGCVAPVGEQGACIARTAVLNADYDQSVSGVQINRFCASGLEATNMAAAQVMSGQSQMSIGGGVESMSRVPMGSDGGAMVADPSVAIKNYFVPQGISADLIATKYGFSRDDVDSYAVESQKRAKKAWDEKRFSKSITPVKDINGLTVLDHDEHMRPDATMQSLGSLDPSFAMMGEMAGFDATIQQRYPEVEAVNHVHTAGNSSGIVDGAAGILLGNKEMGDKYGLKARAKIKGFASTGSEPSIMLTGPGYVSDKLLKNLGMSKSDIDLWELNEAFAVVVLRYMEHMGIDHSDINVNGGAMALGHPLGATGAKLMTTLLHEMERRESKYGLQAICEGGGTANALIIERLN